MNHSDFLTLSERVDWLIRLNRRSEAKEVAKKLVSVFPESAFAYFQLARCCQRDDSESLETSLDAVNQSIGLDPQFAEAFSLKGWIVWCLGNPDRARHDFHQALQLHPESIMARRLMAELEASESRYDSAWEHVLQGLAIDSSDSGLIAIRAQLELAERDLDRAEVTIRSGLNLEPDNDLFHHLLGMVLEQRSDWFIPDERIPLLEASRKEFREAIRLNPTEQKYAAYLQRIEARIQFERNTIRMNEQAIFVPVTAKKPAIAVPNKRAEINGVTFQTATPRFKSRPGMIAALRMAWASLDRIDIGFGIAFLFFCSILTFVMVNMVAGQRW